MELGRSGRTMMMMISLRLLRPPAAGASAVQPRVIGSAAPPELHRCPESANNNPLKRTGTPGDLTIVRPAAAAPPRRPEQGRSASPAQPLARCLDRQQQARKRDRLVAPVELWR